MPDNESQYKYKAQFPVISELNVHDAVVIRSCGSVVFLTNLVYLFSTFYPEMSLCQLKKRVDDSK